MESGRESVEGSFESVESDAERIRERGDELEERAENLSEALAKLEADTAVTKSLEANERDLEAQREENEAERTDALASLDAIRAALEAVEETNDRSDAALDSLRELGEDVSEAESIIEDRRRWIEELNTRVEHLYELLGENYNQLGVFSPSGKKNLESFAEQDEEADNPSPSPENTLDAREWTAEPTKPPARRRPESALSSPGEVARTVFGLSATTQRIMMLPNGNACFNAPDVTGQSLNFRQGNAVRGFQGTCGLCSCENVARLAGKDITEADVISTARRLNCCVQNRKDPGDNGGTSPAGRQAILRSLGIDSVLDNDISLGHIAGLIESGRGVIASVGVRDFWPNYPHKGNHAITITSVERAPSGQVVAFYVCDSGSRNPDFARRVEAALLARSLNPRPLNVTKSPIR
ncbi:hypothetical protein [Thermophilibacter sp.]|uniref:hypothetical protein n=1 Tax=Thermophilibacter sp. TaxID=2847309 RepID=UPI003A8DB3A5